jgi:NADH:ubiquinone oxidoreductase subunit 4 (subunit M)
MLRKDQMLKKLNAYSSMGFVLRIIFDIVISKLSSSIFRLISPSCRATRK